MAKDPAHFHYYYATVAPVGLFFNDQQYPFSLPEFRKAISYAINRQQIYKIAEYGYEPPADALGIPTPGRTGRIPASRRRPRRWPPTTPQAQAMLQSAGFTYKGGQLYDPKGNQVTLTLS